MNKIINREVTCRGSATTALATIQTTMTTDGPTKHRHWHLTCYIYSKIVCRMSTYKSILGRHFYNAPRYTMVKSTAPKYHGTFVWYTVILFEW